MVRLLGVLAASLDAHGLATAGLVRQAVALLREDERELAELRARLGHQPRACRRCGRALDGRQRDWCSDRCRKRVERVRVRPR